MGIRATQWFVYLIRCKDNSLYCGVTVDLNRRINQHRKGTASKYTRAKGYLRLETSAGPFTESQARKLEWQVKQQKKEDKIEFLEEIDV